MNIYDDSDPYEAYEYKDHSRSAHRKRRGRSNQKSRREHLAELTDFSDDLTDFVPSYAAALDPRHHERWWVIQSIGPFYRDNLITDLTHAIKVGKEANVYRCDAHEVTGQQFFAAKLYRPRMLRHLKNDAIYKAGRELRDQEGKFVRNRREKVALRKKTRFGKNLDIMWWIGNEYAVQTQLYEAGADVPQPIAHQGNCILMAYIGDEQMPAPTLNDVTLTSTEEAEALFAQTLANVQLMLELNHVHGDLSAYNILYWEGKLTIIDFPQLSDARQNPHAQTLFMRDVQRICDYFTRFGVQADAVVLALTLWEQYLNGRLATFDPQDRKGWQS